MFYWKGNFKVRAVSSASSLLPGLGIDTAVNVGTRAPATEPVAEQAVKRN